MTPTEGLVLARLRILRLKEDDIKAAAKKATAFRTRVAGRTDEANESKRRAAPLSKGDLVLLYDDVKYNSMSNKDKLRPRWTGPYWIVDLGLNDKVVTLQELDGDIRPQTPIQEPPPSTANT